MNKLIGILLITCSLYGYELDNNQKEILKIVKTVAKNIPDKNGKTHEDIMCAICITESSAGKAIIGDLKKNRPLEDGSLGIMQLRISTVRYLASIYSDLSFINKIDNKTLTKILLNNHHFSAKIATKYFIHNKNKFNSTFKGISLYNGGLNNYTYYERVLNKKGKLKFL